MFTGRDQSSNGRLAPTAARACQSEGCVTDHTSDGSPGHGHIFMIEGATIQWHPCHFNGRPRIGADRWRDPGHFGAQEGGGVGRRPEGLGRGVDQEQLAIFSFVESDYGERREVRECADSGDLSGTSWY
jgi:hypothetical protein